ncbi:hypothetical protein UACE39S_06308 [Ureibacillus acetophenoni]
MNLRSQTQKPVQGCILEGVYGYQFHLNENFTLSSSEFVLKIRNIVNKECWFWKLSWFEDENLDDHLIVNEQDTPEPLEYMQEPIISDEYFVLSSRFGFSDNLIHKVSGYGLKGKDYEILTTLAFEFEESYLLVKTGPMMEVRYTKQKPEIIGEFFFTYN